VPRPERLFATALVLALGLAGAAGAASRDAAQEKLRETERQLEEVEQRREAAQRGAEQAARELAELRRRSVETAARVQAAGAQLSAAEERLAELEAELAATRAELRTRRESLQHTVGALLRLARQPPSALLAQPAGLVDNLRAARLLGLAVPEVEADARALSGLLARLGDSRQAIEGERAAAADAAERLRAGQAELRRLAEEKTGQRKALAEEARRESERLQTIGAEARDLRDLLKRLAEEEERRAREAELRRQAEARRLAEEKARAAERARAEAEAARLAAARAETERAETERAETERAATERERAAAQAEAAARSAPPAVVAARPSAPPRVAALPPGLAFSAARGRMPMPVRGRVVEGFGSTGQNGQKARGLRVETRPGTPVVAPFGGRVAFAGPFRGYGLLLIIAHGEAYHTLLAGMAKITAAVGEELVAGEPVGEMGPGEGGSPALYVELRHKGEPIDPLPWMAADNGKVSG